MLSLEMQAIARIMLVVKIATAVANRSPPAKSNIPKNLQTAIMTTEEMIIARIPMPDIGLEEVPTRPAIYAQAAATKNPTTTASKTPIREIITF